MVGSQSTSVAGEAWAWARRAASQILAMIARLFAAPIMVCLSHTLPSLVRLLPYLVPGMGSAHFSYFFARLRDDAIEATASDTYRLAMTGNTTLTAPRPHVDHVSTQHNTIAKRLAYSCNWIKRSTSVDLS